MIKSSFKYLLLLLLIVSPVSTIFASSDLLSSEENIWLNSRNNTISVIPERNNPPFSFNDSTYISQGIFVDYIKLVGEKLNIKVDFVTARTRADIITSMSDNKADYVSMLEVDKSQSLPVLFSEPFATFPVVIAVRKDFDGRDGMTLDEFNNHSVAVIKDSPVSVYIKENYPRVITDEVVDNELALQKVALNEVDAAVINSASLSYLLSKQSMRSLKVVGSLITDSKMAFIVPKDKAILSSIIAKGLKQISAKEHQQIIDKWILLPNEKGNDNKLLGYISDNLDSITIVLLLMVIVIFMIVIIVIRRKKPVIINPYLNKNAKVEDLNQEISALESASENLLGELKEVKALEEDIKHKMQNIEK